jgi:hypothetical protein
LYISPVRSVSLKIKNVNVIQMGKLPIQWMRQGGGFSSRSPTMARRGTAEHCSVILVEGWSEGLAGGLRRQDEALHNSRFRKIYTCTVSKCMTGYQISE